METSPVKGRTLGHSEPSLLFYEWSSKSHLEAAGEEGKVPRPPLRAGSRNVVSLDPQASGAHRLTLLCCLLPLVPPAEPGPVPGSAPRAQGGSVGGPQAPR